MKQIFDREPVCNEKSFEGKISINFHCDKVPKEGCQCIFLLVILLILFLEVEKATILKCF